MTKNLKHDLIEYGRLIGAKDFSPGISGNISARSGDNILITSSGSANGYLEDEDIVEIDFCGYVVEGSKKPSSEKFLHIEFYKQRADIQSVIHVHSPYLTAFAACAKPLDEPVSPEIIYCFGKIPLAEYALPGSDELVKKTSTFFKDYDIILMENHGVIVGGSSIKDAYLKLELAEGYAKTIICTKFIGGAKILSEQEVEKIYSLRTLR